MKKCPCLSTLVLAVSYGLSGPLVGQGTPYYTEGFDSAGDAKIVSAPGSDVEISVVDYGNLSVLGFPLSFVEAPSQIGGSQPTRGLMLRQKYSTYAPATTGPRYLNALLTDATKNPQTFSGNYRLRFDAFLATANLTSGTTEALLYGLGHNNSPTSRSAIINLGASAFPAGSVPVGLWGWISNEGGIGTGTGDASVIQGTTALQRLEDLANLSLWQAAFSPTAIPSDYAPNNTWTRVAVSVVNGTVRVSYNGVLFHERTYTPTTLADGFAFVGYEDSFTGSSPGTANTQPRASQFLLVDNIVVEEAVPPTLSVNEQTPFKTVFAAGDSSSGVFRISNATASPISLTSASITGADTADFTVTTTFPVEVPATGFADVAVTFNPQGSANSTRRASLSLANSVEPQLNAQLTARRSVAAFLQAHYPLDEAGGTIVRDRSDARLNGGYIAREPLVFGQPTLLPLTEGKSVGFLPADLQTTGNYITTPALLSPSFSISMWIKPQAVTRTTPANRTLFQRSSTFGLIDDIYGCYLNDAGALILNIGNTAANSPPVISLPNGTIANDTAYHVVVTHSDADGLSNTTATRTRVWVDGEIKAEKLGAETKGHGDYAATAGSSLRLLYIGSRTSAGAGYRGWIDDIQVYGAELDNEAVAKLFENPGLNTVEIANRPPEIIAVDGSTPGSLSYTFKSLLGAPYQLQKSPNLIDWTTIDATILGTGPTTTRTLSGFNTEPRAYFQVIPR